MTVQTLAIIVLLVSFFVMIFLRFPIAYAVGLSSVLCMMVQGQALTDVCRLMVKGISSFSLMAVPFFITMGVLMGSGGISEKLIALADACVGWMRGGMAMVNIVASYFFGGTRRWRSRSAFRHLSARYWQTRCRRFRSRPRPT